MTGEMGDEAPRLPPRPPADPRVQQLELDLTESAGRAAAQLDLSWPPFEEPALLSLREAKWTIVVTRVIAFLWSLAVVVTAVEARADAQNGRQVGSSLTDVGRLGIGVAALVAVAGWLWSDRAVRNVHRLGGRLPTLPRCVSAWTLPLMFALLLAVTVVRLEPGELLDVRPAIVVPVFALAVWRPFSLIRRMLTTITRLRSDALIGAAYILELSGFGLIWWQLATRPAEVTPGNAGAADLMIGIGSASAVGFAAAIAVWAFLLRDVDRAQVHRLLTLRTRHDHRYLRLSGINPMDPEVRWALLKIRQQEELARLAAAEPQAPPIDEQPAAPAAAAAATVGEAMPTAGADEEQSVQIESVPEVAPLLSEIVATDAGEKLIADLVAEIATSERSASIIADLVEEVAADSSAPVAGSPVEELEAALSNIQAQHTSAAEPPIAEEAETALEHDDREAAEPQTASASVPPAPAAPTESLPEFAVRLRARLRAAREEGAGLSAVDSTAQRASAEDRAERLARRLDTSGHGERANRTVAASSGRPSDMTEGAPPSLPRSKGELPRNGTGSDATGDRIDRLAGRLGDIRWDEPRSLLQRLEEFGIHPEVSENGKVKVPAEHEPQFEERWIPPRLFALDASRYVLLLAIAAIAATSAWIVTRTASVGSHLAEGEIAADDVVGIDSARRAMVTALSVTLALVPLWCGVVASHAHRARMPDVRPMRAYALCAVASALGLLSFIIDGETRGQPSFVCILGSLAAALLAIVTMLPIVRWFNRSSTSLTLWAAGLPLLVAMSWLGGLQRPVEPADAFQTITFVAALQAIAAGIVVVVAALSTSDIEDAIRVSPELAQPVRQSPLANV